MKEIVLEATLPIFTWRACELFYEDASFEKRHLQGMNPSRSDIFISDWRQVDGRTKQRSISYALTVDSVSYLKYITNKSQDKVQVKKFETLTFDENVFEVTWKILFDVSNSPIVSAKITFSAQNLNEGIESSGVSAVSDDEEDDNATYGPGSESTSCKLVSKCEFRGHLFKEMIEGLLEAETKLDLEHWLQVAKEDAIRDRRRRKSKLVGGFMSPSLASLRSFPPADVSPSQRTPPMRQKRHSRTSSPESTTSTSISASDSSPTSQKLWRRHDADATLPPLSSSISERDIRKDIDQISRELDSVKVLLEQNVLRSSKLECNLERQIKQLEEAEDRARIAAALAPGSLEEQQRDILERVRDETIRLEETVKKLEEDEEKSRDKDDVILDAKIDDLTQKLNNISIRNTYSMLRSWRQLCLLLVFMALWPIVLRYFWTLYGRTFLKRLFRTVDWLYRLRDSTEPAIHVLMRRGRRVARRDILGLRS
eukprot:TRINITY_DN4372_c0_g1_i1.p1 TRINITY_DN4372_c0_g1~~TRINITY_DN4372_c0_g1_i1.p1  ORF type:complete len:483 (-),score=96.26 TRINITY_DN4372_c0_g1_i1:12-1460(-)